MILDDPIFVVQARDRDTSENFNEIEYSIRAGGLHDEIFHVNESSGQIYVKTKLDREQTEKMTLEILAVDSGSPRLTGNCTTLIFKKAGIYFASLISRYTSILLKPSLNVTVKK